MSQGVAAEVPKKKNPNKTKSKSQSSVTSVRFGSSVVLKRPEAGARRRFAPGGIVQKVSVCRSTFSSMFSFYFTVPDCTRRRSHNASRCFLLLMLPVQSKNKTKQTRLGECHENEGKKTKTLADFHSVTETKCKLEECEDFIFYRFQEMHDVFQ